MGFRTCLVKKTAVFRRVLAVILGFGLIVPSAGCSFSGGGPSSSPSVSWNERDSPDAISVAVPPGWVLFTADERKSIIHLQIANDRDHVESSLIVVYLRPGIGFLRGFNGDVKKLRDSLMEDALRGKSSSNVVPLGPREIGGSQAWGFSRIVTIPGEEPYPMQEWYIWREDGEWEFEIRGFRGADEVPAELVAALDTVRFFPPYPSPSPSAKPTANSTPTSTPSSTAGSLAPTTAPS